MTLSTLPISYCTNVHPGQSVAAVIEGINTHTAAAQKGFGRPMAAGLWLSRAVVSQLRDDPQLLEQLGQSLWQHDLTCYTLNTFPFGDFHSERVKANVYLPDWASEKRLAYTLDCAHILAQVLPPTGEGSLSTVPLGGTMNSIQSSFGKRCIGNIIHASQQLATLKEETGRTIRLAIEPEPLCHLSSIPRDVIPWFHQLLQSADSAGHADTVREFTGLCLDVCHQAVEFENVAASIDLLEQNGIRINKVHITNAVELQDPSHNDRGRHALMSFVETRYLHQTYAQFADGTIHQRMDLDVDDIQRSPVDEFLQAERWRIHFHVPIFSEILGPLNTTRADLQLALNRVDRLSYAPHLEVETYTWPVMPDDTAAPASLAKRIAGELQAAMEIIQKAGRQ